MNRRLQTLIEAIRARISEQENTILDIVSKKVPSKVPIPEAIKLIEVDLIRNRKELVKLKKEEEVNV